MVTINQLSRFGRRRNKPKTLSPHLKKCPQRLGTCVRVFTSKPKKPNSAIRKVAKVKLTTGRIISIAIPGIGHRLQEHSTVLVRGGRANDLPGVRYKAIRGLYDFIGPERINRGSRRSKFGVKRKEV